MATKKRYVKVPIGLCRPMNELDRTEHIVYVGYYSKVIEDNEYIIDIRQTASNNYYVSIFDVTDEKYEEVEFNQFKEKYAQPTLFDFFDL